MSKTPVVIHLDTDLVSKIKAALPDTNFKTVEAAVADLVGDAIVGDHSVWTKAISWQPGESEEETTTATEITHDSFHITADRAYSAASEILGVAESQDTDTSQGKTALRHKVIELGRLLDDMKYYVGIPATAQDTPPLPTTSIADIPRDIAKRLNPIISTCQEETMLNGGALAAFIADALVITANEGATGADHAYLFGWAIKAALDYESGV